MQESGQEEFGYERRIASPGGRGAMRLDAGRIAAGTRAAMVLAAALFAACSGTQSEAAADSEQADGAPIEALAPKEALARVQDYTRQSDELARFAELEPFFVGTPAGYVERCDELQEIQTLGDPETFGDALLVVYRTEFKAYGGGSEDIFVVTPEGDVHFQGGLKGR